MAVFHQGWLEVSLAFSSVSDLQRQTYCPREKITKYLGNNSRFSQVNDVGLGMPRTAIAALWRLPSVSPRNSSLQDHMPPRKPFNSNEFKANYASISSCNTASIHRSRSR
jgi:hypothetical protein